MLGVNIGKNADTPVERAIDDYLIGLRKVYPWAGYVTVNISSPNTPGLRDLQVALKFRRCQFPFLLDFETVGDCYAAISFDILIFFLG